jgi:hypothetical protein
VSACPQNYTQSSDDPYECVSTIPCPDGFTAKEGSNTECNKPAPTTITESQSCAPGFDEWEQNLCYESCPVGFTDNGLSCLKNSLTRDAVILLKHCSSILYYSPFEGAPCIFSPIGVLIVGLCGIFFLWSIYVVYKFMNDTSFLNKTCSTDKSLLKRINSYFVSK